MTPNPVESLVIGYGNTLRRDDGAGPWVAAEIEARGWSGVRTLAVPQLAPELAADLATACSAVFVDARLGPARHAVEARRVEPQGADSGMTHVCDPGLLLRMAHALYGWAPQAWLITVAGEDFGLGEGLTELALRRAQAAVERIESLLRPV
jgi:hydrogenase maturation protease